MFKNAIPFRLTGPLAADAEAPAYRLARKRLVAPGAQDMLSRGWVAPRDGGDLVHEAGGRWLIAMGQETKILPAATINAEATRRAVEIAEQQGFALGRRMMRELRDKIAAELLPRAFTRPSRMLAWIDPEAGWLVVDTSSPARAEGLLELLRQTLDSLPIAQLRTRRAPIGAMADWLAAGKAPDGFTIDQDCELRSITAEGATVRYAHHTLEGDEIKNHLAAGKLPTRLAMTYDDRVSFVLTERLQIKRLDFLDMLTEQLRNGSANDAQEMFDAEFALFAGELSGLLSELVAAMGGCMKGGA